MEERIKIEKQRVRETIWKLLEDREIARFPRPVFGRIPNFYGAETASKLLSLTEEFKNAKVIKVNPDSPQRYLREIALKNRKKVLVPTPRLKGSFFLLNPEEINSDNIKQASSISGFAKYGIKVNLEEIPKIDLIVVGSVAVTIDGKRVGKGEGYSELEYAILREEGKVGEETPIATTVHELQIVDYIPEEPFDVSLDIIATNERIIRPPRRAKPKGIILKYLSKTKIEETPYLKHYLRRKGLNHSS
jgi:5-formyltetrahydrofolate cyclo-ligase